VRVLIIDCGTSNLSSVCRAFEEGGGKVVISRDPTSICDFDRLVLPGVGAFPQAMTALNKEGWPAEIKKALANPKVELLGICLGMQLLATEGLEIAHCKGLDLIPGEVTRLCDESFHMRIPHVGWNAVEFIKPHRLLTGLASGVDFYFVHSYHFSTADRNHSVAQTPYCGNFSSIVSLNNVHGVQFHPEKSSRAGLRLIRNFLATQ